MGEKHVGRRALVRRVSYLAAAFAVAIGLAVQGHREAAAYRQALSNSRLHAFAELSAGLNELDADLQKVVYSASPAMLSALCTQIYGKAAAAQMALGELPYSNVELEQTAAFLARTGDYAAALSRSVIESGGCTQEQRTALEGLSQAASALSAQVAELQAQLLTGGAGLGDAARAESLLSRQTEGSGRVSGYAYQSMEADFPEVPSLIYDGPFSEHLEGRSPKMLEGRTEVAQDEARLAAARFLDLRPEIFALAATTEGSLPSYTFTAVVDGGELSVQVARQGGLVVEVLNSRSPGAPVLSRDEALEQAKAFLEQRGYPDMRETYFIEQGGALTINFAALQDGVLCYPDLVKVSIALDTGKITGFESMGYLMNHTARELPAPAVSESEARQALSPALTVLAHQLALIPTGGEYEVLCHEFKCQGGDGQSVIEYLDAQTGQEERILLLLEEENGTLAL